MRTYRIIPRLDIKGPNVVKGIHLEGLRVMGKPSEFAKYYYENGADELLFMDVVASLYERNSLHNIISETAEDIFIPLTVGGGLRTIEDIRSVLRAGADKVAINTAAIRNPDFVSEAAEKFGSSTIVVAVECIKDAAGVYRAYVDNGREYTGVDALEWAGKIQELGAGELLLTSVDKEGTGEGFDVAFTKKIKDQISIPVIAHGGAGKKEDVLDVLQSSGCDAVSLASIFHYNIVANGMLNGDDKNFSEGNVDFLNSKRAFHTFQHLSIKELKDYLITNRISCREFAEQ